MKINKGTKEVVYFCNKLEALELLVRKITFRVICHYILFVLIASCRINWMKKVQVHEAHLKAKVGSSEKMKVHKLSRNSATSQ